jgi:hypothetical protein
MSQQTIAAGDWVRAETGEVGKVVHIARLTMFVQLEAEPTNSTLKAFLASQLTKIEPPNHQSPAESHQQS